MASYKPLSTVKWKISKSDVIEYVKNTSSEGIIYTTDEGMDTDENSAISNLPVYKTPDDKIIAAIPNIKHLSPAGRLLLHNVSPARYSDFVNMLLEDSIVAALTSDLSSDKDYYPNEENIGITAEKILSIYGNCPVCKKNTLRQFKDTTMPVVDLICINDEHNIYNGPRLWQVKASQNNFYFNLDSPEFMTVGSRNWGNAIHQNYKDVNFLIGYICLYVRVIEGDPNYYISPNSFIIRPNMTGGPYYEYINKDDIIRKYGAYYNNKNIIRSNNCIKQTFNLDYPFILSPELKVDRIHNNVSVNMENLTTYIDSGLKLISPLPNIYLRRSADSVSTQLFSKKKGHVGGEKYKIEYTY